MKSNNDNAARRGMRSVASGIALNLFLVVLKAAAGLLGNSYALVADAIESGADVLTSCVVAVGLKLSRKPADETHPYGHGKFEPLAAAIVAAALMAAAILIAVQSVQALLVPRVAPEPFTLIVLLAAIVLKELLFRHVNTVGEQIGSSAVRADAWHHRSDSITSAAAFVGIAVAQIGGPQYARADALAALVASAVIALNAVLVFRPALFELIDTAPDRSIAENVRAIAHRVPGVLGTHKCHVRKLGFDFFVDLDVLCDPNLSIRQGHEIAHQVGDALHSAMPSLAKVLVHVEPADDYGRRSRDKLGE